MKISNAAVYVFCIAAMIFLGRFELHTDDTGVEVVFLLLMTFILGSIHPKRAWLWGLAALCVPAADLVSRASFSLKGSLLGVAAFVTVIGFVGSYSGVLFRRVLPGKAA